MTSILGGIMPSSPVPLMMRGLRQLPLLLVSPPLRSSLNRVGWVQAELSCFSDIRPKSSGSQSSRPDQTRPVQVGQTLTWQEVKTNRLQATSWAGCFLYLINLLSPLFSTFIPRGGLGPKISPCFSNTPAHFCSLRLHYQPDNYNFTQKKTKNKLDRLSGPKNGPGRPVHRGWPHVLDCVGQPCILDK